MCRRPAEIARKYRLRADALEKLTHDQIFEACERAAKRLGKTSPKQTGRLARSWQAVRTKSGAKLVNTAPYAINQPGLSDEAKAVLAEELESMSLADLP